MENNQPSDFLNPACFENKAQLTAPAYPVWRVRAQTLESPGHGLRSQLGWLPLGVRAQGSPLEDLALGPRPHLYTV